MVDTPIIEEEKIKAILASVCDPEIPVLSIADMGILRAVKINKDEVEIVITPTYTGCPAMDMIAMSIRLVLHENGYRKIKINSILSPAWSSDWMTEEGKQKLKRYGIAAPDKNFEFAADGVECPQCNSTNTKLISEFGSTACKALYQCHDCKEPFDYFKCH